MLTVWYSPEKYSLYLISSDFNCEVDFAKDNFKYHGALHESDETFLALSVQTYLTHIPGKEHGNRHGTLHKT
jgi:hypothetical protein